MSMEYWWHENDMWKIKVLGEKTCPPPATASTINPTNIGL